MNQTVLLDSMRTLGIVYQISPNNTASDPFSHLESIMARFGRVSWKFFCVDTCIKLAARLLDRDSFLVRDVVRATSFDVLAQFLNEALIPVRIRQCEDQRAAISSVNEIKY